MKLFKTVKRKLKASNKKQDDKERNKFGLYFHRQMKPGRP